MSEVDTGKNGRRKHRKFISSDDIIACSKRFRTSYDCCIICDLCKESVEAKTSNDSCQLLHMWYLLSDIKESMNNYYLTDSK